MRKRRHTQGRIVCRRRFLTKVVVDSDGKRIILLYPERFASFGEAARKDARRAKAQPGYGSSAYLVFCFVAPVGDRKVQESVWEASDEWTAWLVAAQQLRISYGFPRKRRKEG